MSDNFGSNSGGKGGTEIAIVIAMCCCSSMVIGLFLWYAYKHQDKFPWLDSFFKLFKSEDAPLPVETPAAGQDLVTGLDGTTMPGETMTPEGDGLGGTDGGTDGVMQDTASTGKGKDPNKGKGKNPNKGKGKGPNKGKGKDKKLNKCKGVRGCTQKDKTKLFGKECMQCKKHDKYPCLRWTNVGKNKCKSKFAPYPSLAGPPPAPFNELQ